MVSPDTGFLFGHASKRLGIGGAVAYDLTDNLHRATGIRESQKSLTEKYDIFQKIIKENGIVPDRKEVGASSAIIALGYRNLSGPEDGTVIFFTPLAVHDDTTPSIRHTMEQEYGVELRVTDFHGVDAKNSQSLILPPEQERTIVSFRDSRTPPIQYDRLEPTPDALFIGTQGGDQWWQGIHNGLDFAEDQGIPVFTQMSSPVITQAIKDPTKKAAYHRLVNNATGFFGNRQELALTLRSLDIRHSRDRLPAKARRLKDRSANMQYVRVTASNRPTVAIGPDNNAYIAPITEVTNLVDTLGGGDERTAVELYHFRRRGTEPAAIMEGLALGTLATTGVLQSTGALSGQMRHAEYTMAAQNVDTSRIRIIKADRWV